MTRTYALWRGMDIQGSGERATEHQMLKGVLIVWVAGQDTGQLMYAE